MRKSSVQLTVIIISSINGSISASNLPALLAVMAFGLTGMGIALCVTVLWIRRWPYAQALMLGLLGIMVTVLCLPGILFFTKPLNAPEEMSSQVYVFATGAPTQRLSVEAVFNPSNTSLSFPTGMLSPGEESFTIHNGSNCTIHWAVLLDNDARFALFNDVPANITHRDVSVDASLSGSVTASNPDDYSTIPAQLFTGVLAGDSSEMFYGKVVGIFETSAISSSAAYLPTYSQGSLSGVSKRDTAIIIHGLGGAPTLRHDRDFTITLTGGMYDPSLESLSNAQPSLDPTLESEGVVQWTGDESIFNPQYNLSSQNGADVATDGLFVFAIFLGVAGASLLAGLQCLVQVLSSRKR